MKTLFIVNDMSGHGSGAPLSYLIDRYAEGEYHVIHLSSPYDKFSPEGFERIVVLGGDGTLNNTLNLCKDMTVDIFYYACGTLNEKSKIKGDPRTFNKIGKIDDKIFSYVCASGSFTEIGYRTKTEAKKRFKFFAYMAMAFKSYRVHRIPCEISWGEESIKGDFTLVMLLDSPRCFGFNFNRLYGKNPNELFLLAIKAPKAKGFLGKILMFFPFFKAFFLGFSKEKRGKTITFVSFERLKLKCPPNTPFSLDGEKWTSSDKELWVEKKETNFTLHLL